jgi:precorrin-2 dehydrogenase/sirohydrochlorin ferrochelatase
MKYYPVYLDLRERPCVIAGGGRVAERKTLSLLEAGANVTIISPSLTPKLLELSSSGRISHSEKKIEEQDIRGACLVIAATDSPETNTLIGRLCKESNILVNVASPPEESTFIVPSVVDRGELLIAISSGGASPALSRKIRAELEKLFGPEYDLFLRKMALVRNRLAGEVPDEEKRREIFRNLVNSDLLVLLKQGRVNEADRRIAEISGLNVL